MKIAGVVPHKTSPPVAPRPRDDRACSALATQLSNGKASRLLTPTSPVGSVSQGTALRVAAENVTTPSRENAGSSAGSPVSPFTPTVPKRRGRKPVSQKPQEGGRGRLGRGVQTPLAADVPANSPEPNTTPEVTTTSGLSARSKRKDVATSRAGVEGADVNSERKELITKPRAKKKAHLEVNPETLKQQEAAWEKMKAMAISQRSATKDAAKYLTGDVTRIDGTQDECVPKAKAKAYHVPLQPGRSSLVLFNIHTFALDLVRRGLIAVNQLYPRALENAEGMGRPAVCDSGNLVNQGMPDDNNISPEICQGNEA
jgi:hypothetical protein